MTPIDVFGLGLGVAWTEQDIAERDRLFDIGAADVWGAKREALGLFKTSYHRQEEAERERFATYQMLQEAARVGYFRGVGTYGAIDWSGWDFNNRPMESIASHPGSSPSFFGLADDPGLLMRVQHEMFESMFRAQGPAFVTMMQDARSKRRQRARDAMGRFK